MALIALGSAAAAPFSHKLHLKLKPDCASCHVSAAASTKASDNNLPVKDACVQCHKDERKIKPPATTLVANFNHQFHLKFGNLSPLFVAAIQKQTYLAAPKALPRPEDTARHLSGNKNACVACHRGLAESDQVSHENFPQMADCLVCHNKIDPPFSCSTCHAKSAQLKPASHSPDYIDVHNRRKERLDKPSCAPCHGVKFTCLGCH